MDRKQFGKLVAALRKEQYDENGDRYTQAMLAEVILKQDRQTPLNDIVIGKIERGERTILDDQTLLNLANALKLTIGERRNFFYWRQVWTICKFILRRKPQRICWPWCWRCCKIFGCQRCCWIGI